jgi:DNA polymerase-3 subunit chi
MTEIRFYHTQIRSAEEVLPDLLSKALKKFPRIACKVADEERCLYFDDYLWHYHPQAFLPHGTDHDILPEHQPILLMTGDTALNGAKTLMVMEEATLPANLSHYDLICLVFDGRDPRQREPARQYWAQLKKEQQDVTLSYWQQQDSGQWINKA